MAQVSKTCEYKLLIESSNLSCRAIFWAD